MLRGIFRKDSKGSEGVVRRDADRLERTYRHHDAIRKEAVAYVVSQDQSFHPLRRLFATVRHVFAFAAKLVLPDFIVGHPNLWDNLKVLVSERSFRPLRSAVVAWLIFSIIVMSSGLYAVIRPQRAEASGTFSMKTGYYMGTGASLSISGVGFRPEVLIIKADTAAGSMIWKTSTMPSATTSYLGVATADNNDSEISLDSDGFSVSTALEVNTVNVRYVYAAYYGSDCSSSGVMCVGSYTGSGAASQVISTGFQPDLVIAKRTSAVVANFRTSSMPASNAAFFSAAVNDATGVYFQTLDVGGSFTVGATNNGLAGVFNYVAFKNLAGSMYVGTFTGDGLDNKNIAGVGFEPDFALVKQNSANAAVFNTTETWGDNSSVATATANTVNNIQSLDADGFQVGNSVNVNANTVVSFYFAMGGAPDPAPAGTFLMERGSYTGTGVAQSITTTFRPDLVMIKANATQYGVWSTSMENNLTHYFANSAVGFADGIKSMAATSFTVGANATVNGLGNTYEYTVYGNATTPQRGAGAADFMIGTHTGNGITARSIDHLGITPSMITMTRTITTAALTMWKAASPTMADNTAAYFSATADVTDGTAFAAIGTTAFSLGTAATTNAAAGSYVWFAFKEGAQFDIGSYTGSGISGKNVTGLGFNPAFVWTKGATAVQGSHRSTSTTISGATAQYYTNIVNAAAVIIAFVSDGFTVGTAAEANSNTVSYRYSAWKSTSSANAPSTPTNSSPASSATGQGLTVTLTGSAYSDPDSNAQTDAMWQVDDDADFATPVWSRTAGAAEATTSVTSGNGTFANELAGDTALDHNTTYYWRVKYSDGMWSSWSTGTSFTTNTISTPTHSSPSDGGTVTTLTPTLTASAFSDAQGGHSSAYAQWQIDTGSTFTSPLYDSGTVSYGNSLAVPAATLSDKTTYYWRVRYEDSTNQWSPYSTATRFYVAQSLVAVYPLFSGSVVDQGDSVNLDVQVKLTDGTAINDATVTVNVYNPSGTKIVTAQAMSYLSGSSGVYRYTYTVPSTSGSYLYEVSATSGSVSGTGAANFAARTISHDISAISSAVTLNEAAAAAERAAASAERAAQSASRAVVLSLQTDITGLVSEIGTGRISAIKTATDSIDWADVTGIVTDTGAIKLKTDTINWSHVTAIKTATDTINWGDVTGIATAVSSLQTSLASLITEIGTGNIAAIKTKTDTISWGNVTSLVTESGAIKTKTDSIDWTQVAAIKTTTDTIDWGDVTGIDVKITALQSSLADLITEVGIGSIAAIKTATDTIDWGDVTSILTTTGAVKTTTDTIDWSQVAAIKTSTDTIDWSDVTGIATAVSALQTSLASLITEIGTGNIAAIKTATDSINWSNVTTIVTNTGAIQTKTDTIDWGDVALIKSATDTIDWTDVTGIDVKVSAVQTSIAGVVSEIGTGNIAAIKTKTDTIDWADVSEVVTTTGTIRTSTDAISWADVAAIKTKTDTIAWGDVTGIKLKTDTIAWGDITTIKANVASLMTEIGTGNISAILTSTSAIPIEDLTSLVTTTGQIKAATDTIDWADIAAIQTKTDTIDWDAVTGIKVKTDTIAWGDVAAIATQLTAVQNNLDVLIGAMIVTRSTVSDASATSTSFVTALSNTTDNFYTNAVLTFTSGTLNGQVRRISAYNGTTKSITVSPALSLAPGNGDAFTIAKQNVYIEQLAAANEATQASFRSDVTSRLTSIEGKVDTLTTMLSRVETNLDSLQTTVDALRASQDMAYTVILSDVSEVQAGETYRAKLTISNFESDPADASSTPTITIYDSTRTVIVSEASMTKLSTGVYEYTSSVSSDATGGLWESVVSVDAGGAQNLTRNDYWQVSGAPSQVLITAMTDLVIPDISAAVTITNEGGAEYEYHYEWCVVSSMDNDCGGDDDVYYASAAKLIDVGDSFHTTLTATVATTGSYWFKVMVYFGTQGSGASRTFVAVAADGGDGGETSSSSGSSGGSSSHVTPDISLATNETIYAEITATRQELALNAANLTSVLSTVGVLSSSLETLLAVGNENTQGLQDVQNKIADLRAVAATTQQLIASNSVQPIVQTYMKFNSVEIHFLITNPADIEQTVHFSAFLPEEAKPEDVLDLSGLSIDYDATASAYRVYGDVTLGPKETITKKVEMKDIWVYAEEDIAAMRKQIASLVPSLTGTQYAAQASLLQSDITAALDQITSSQNASYSSPQEHIVTYRSNADVMARAQTAVEKLKDLVVEAGASQGVVGKIGGIQTFTTWGIILALVFGFGLLAAVIFSMWRHQTVLAAMSLGMSQQEAMAMISGRSVARSVRSSRPARISRKRTYVTSVPCENSLWDRIKAWPCAATRSRIVLGIIFLVLVGVAVFSIYTAMKGRSVSSSKEEQNDITNITEAPIVMAQDIPAPVDPEPEPIIPPVEVPVVVTPSVPYVVILDTPTGWLNVRDRADLSGGVVAKALPGEKYSYQKTENGWDAIVLSNGTIGWILGNYATIVSE